MTGEGLRLRRRTLLACLAAVPLAGVAAGLEGCGMASASTRLAQGWLPPPAARPGSLLQVDVSSVPVYTQTALAILQGLVNARLKPGGQAVYILLPNNYVGGVAFPGADQMWAKIYAASQGVQVTSGTPADVVRLAHAAGITQYVIWDPTVPDTINVANTLAWLRGVAAVDPQDTLVSPIDSPLVAATTDPLKLKANGLTVSLDMRTLNLTSASDAYTWALGQLKSVKPETLALIAVGNLQGDPTEDVLRWSARDYAVVARAFTWISNLNLGETAEVQAILKTVAGRKATMFGWSNNEAEQTILASGHGMVFCGADSPGLSAENLSVHSALRKGGPAKQRPRPAAPTLDPEGVYVSQLFTDGDNISVLIDFHEGRWVDPERGKVPVGWSMQGMAPDWTPALADHYFSTATANDDFVSWLPFGYPDLPSFVTSPMWPSYVASTQAAMSAAGLNVGQSLPHNALVLGEKASGFWDLLHGSHPADGHFYGYTYSQAYPIGEPLWINSRPVLPVGGFQRPIGTGTPAERNITAIQNAIAANPARPLFVYVGMQNDTKYPDAVTTATASYSEPVHFVLPSQLVALMREAWSQGLAHTTLLGVPGGVDQYYLSGSGGGSVLTRVNASGAMARYAPAGTEWIYTFNTEGAKAAALELTATGQGTIAARGAGANWTPVAAISTPSGQGAGVNADLSAVLPAAHVDVRFTAGASSTLAVTALTFRYNHKGAATLPVSPQTVTLPAGTRIQLPYGPNLVANEAPIPQDGITVASAANGGFRVTFPAGTPPLSGGTAWVPFVVPGVVAGQTYVFEFSGMTGTGQAYMDVWNGEADIASAPFTLGATPQSVAMEVPLPVVPPTSPPVQVQMRTGVNPTMVTFTASVYAVR